jgi:hypothetical protein
MRASHAGRTLGSVHAGLLPGAVRSARGFINLSMDEV